MRTSRSARGSASGSSPLSRSRLVRSASRASSSSSISPACGQSSGDRSPGSRGSQPDSVRSGGRRDRAVAVDNPPQHGDLFRGRRRGFDRRAFGGGKPLHDRAEAIERLIQRPGGSLVGQRPVQGAEPVPLRVGQGEKGRVPFLQRGPLLLGERGDLPATDRVRVVGPSRRAAPGSRNEQRGDEPGAQAPAVGAAAGNVDEGTAARPEFAPRTQRRPIKPERSQVHSSPPESAGVAASGSRSDGKSVSTPERSSSCRNGTLSASRSRGRSRSTG